MLDVERSRRRSSHDDDDDDDDEMAAQSAALLPPCVEWRSSICEWYYSVVDHYGYDREAAAVALGLFDRYLVERRERDGRAAAAAAATAAREREAAMAADDSSGASGAGWRSYASSCPGVEEKPLGDEEAVPGALPLVSSSSSSEEDEAECRWRQQKRSGNWPREDNDDDDSKKKKNERRTTRGRSHRRIITSLPDHRRVASPPPSCSPRQSFTSAARRAPRSHRRRESSWHQGNGGRADRRGEEDRRVDRRRPAAEEDERGEGGYSAEEDECSVIDPQDYQLAATACLYLSCKLQGPPPLKRSKHDCGGNGENAHDESTASPRDRRGRAAVLGPRLKISIFASLSQGRFASEDIAATESDVLRALGWRVQSPTAAEFAGRALRGLLLPLLLLRGSDVDCDCDCGAAGGSDAGAADGSSVGKASRRSVLPSFPPLPPHEVHSRRRNRALPSSSSRATEEGFRRRRAAAADRRRRALLALRILSEISGYLIELSLCVPGMACGVDRSLLALAAVDVSCDLLNDDALPPQVMNDFSSRMTRVFGGRRGRRRGEEGKRCLQRRRRRDVRLLRRLKEDMRSKFLREMIDASFASPPPSCSVDASAAIRPSEDDAMEEDASPETGDNGSGGGRADPSRRHRHRHPLAVARDVGMLRPDLMLSSVVSGDNSVGSMERQ